MCKVSTSYSFKQHTFLTYLLNSVIQIDRTEQTNERFHLNKLHMKNSIFLNID